MSQVLLRGVCAVVVGAGALLAGASFAFGAQDKPVTLPNVPVIPELDFAKHPPLGAPILSPDGKLMALSVTATEGKDQIYQLAVLQVPDLKFISRLEMAPHYLPIDINWVDNKRIVMGVGRETAFSEAPVATGDILAVDVDGKNKRLLYSVRSRGSTSAQLNLLKIPIGFGTISGTPVKSNGHFYLTINPIPLSGGSDAQAHKTLVFDIDAQTGSTTEIGSINADDYRFVIHDGIARFAYGVDNLRREHVYSRSNKDDAWKELQLGADSGIFIPVFLNPGGTKLYALSSRMGQPAAFVLSNLDGTNQQLLASHSRADVSSLYRSAPPREPYAAVTLDGKPVLDLLDNSKYAKALKALNQKFPDHFVSFFDLNEDGSKAIVFAVSDRDPGTYALFDFDTGNLRPLYQSMPWLRAEALGERRPFWFKNRSGVEISGFLTLPPGRGEKNLPTILFPHGGPIQISNVWQMGGWEENEAQFLATRGYAVLQVNFRGSSGRGKAFEESGKLQMGTGMLQDLLDALAWSIQNGYSDKARVCAYGASYGGYAAYQLPIYAPPGTFKCSVSYAGVSSIRILADRSDMARARVGQNFLRDAWGMDDPAYVKANSPIDNVEKLNVPVLIIHGEDDQRVPVQNAREMRDELQKRGKPVAFFSKPNEGHGFFNEKNNTERYEVTEKFLAKYLNPDAPVAK